MYPHNIRKATRAATGLAAHPCNDRFDARASVVDFFSALRHYCAAKGIDYAAAERMAHQHFLAETDNAETPVPSQPHCEGHTQFEYDCIDCSDAREFSIKAKELSNER